jgi:hypothetical protein
MATTSAGSPRAARHAAPFAAALVVIAALAVPATSFAQATRTWVSGVGDDANPCSRTAPCKTFAGAISKTAPGGEIDALDPGGFGTVTITKSITISGVGTQASVLASGVTGVNIVAAPTDRVILTNLSINGAGTTLGVDGVKISSAASVRLENDNIFNFSNDGVNFASNSGTGNPQAHLVIENSTIEGNGAAGVAAVPTTSVGERVSIIGSHIDGNGCGVTAGGTCTSTTGAGFPVIANTIGSSLLDNGTGAGSGTSGNGAAIQSVGSTAASVVGADQILGNTIGFSKVASGLIESFGDNDVFGNTTNGTTSGTVTKQVRIWQILSRRAEKIAKARRQARTKHPAAKK